LYYTIAIPLKLKIYNSLRGFILINSGNSRYTLFETLLKRKALPDSNSGSEKSK